MMHSGRPPLFAVLLDQANKLRSGEYAFAETVEEFGLWFGKCARFGPFDRCVGVRSR
jgi:hypothetical protein